MPNFDTQKQPQQGFLPEQPLSYNEVIKYLDQHWTPSIPGTIQKIDALLGSLATKIPAIIITGTSGKSSTIYYLSKLLETEKLKVGVAICPHFNLYNERLSINSSMVSNETFTNLANTVIDLVKLHNISASSKDILVAMSLLHFKQEQVDIALFEQENIFEFDPVTICKPHILGITRIVLPTKELVTTAIHSLLTSIAPHTHVTSADQSKLILHEIAQKTKEVGSTWIMPIRKIAPLPYPYEQLQGRCAALAERIAQTYVNQIINITDFNSTSSLLRFVKKQRGRPSLTAKQYTTYPHKTTEHFWRNLNTQLPNRFQRKELKNCTIVLDNAANIDALENLLLGIRLLNYEKPFKSISFLLGCYDQQFCEHEFIKMARYFFKKMSGQLSFCPISNQIGEQTGSSWNIEKISMIAQHAKIKVAVHKNFKAAYEALSKQLHDPQDLLVITGSQAIISEYLKYEKNKENV